MGYLDDEHYKALRGINDQLFRQEETIKRLHDDVKALRKEMGTVLTILIPGAVIVVMAALFGTFS